MKPLTANLLGVTGSDMRTLPEIASSFSFPAVESDNDDAISTGHTLNYEVWGSDLRTLPHSASSFSVSEAEATLCGDETLCGVWGLEFG